MVEIDVNAMMFLKACQRKLSRQQYKTLRGQVLAGDSQGAMKGLKRLLDRSKQSAQSVTSG